MNVRELPQYGLEAVRRGVNRGLPLIRKAAPAPPDLLPDVIRPLIILPGILGTWPPALAPRGRLDPISKIYQNWLDAFQRLGYVPGVSLFAFPYDWRRKISDLATDLATEVERIQQLSPALALRKSRLAVDYSRVDLLGHSMGGLVARAYIQSDYYSQTVARLGLVAVPQRGSVAAYYAYEGGDTSLIGVPTEGAQLMAALIDTFETRPVGQKLRRIYQNVRHQNMPELYSYTRQNFFSIRDLLPLGAQNYLYRQAEGEQAQTYPFGSPPGYPVNRWLEEFNRPEKVAALDQLEEIFCLYSSSNPTLTRIQVEAPAKAPLYNFGEPIARQPKDNFGPGDGIVPAFSARLQLPDLKPDGQPWQVRLRQEDLSKVLDRPMNHVEIAADPSPVRHLLGYFVRPGLAQPDRSIWDGPPLAARKPNYAALFL